MMTNKRTKSDKQKNEREQTAKGLNSYTGDKKLGGPNRPAE